MGKLKYRTGGGPSECQTQMEGARRNKEILHNPPLLFDLTMDPAERVALNTSLPRYAAVVEEGATVLASVLTSIAADATTQADYSGDVSMRPCCNPENEFCRCSASEYI